MVLLGWIILIASVISEVVRGKSLVYSILSLVILAGLLGLFWNWFLPTVFLVNVGHASFFTLICVVALLDLIAGWARS